MAKAKTARGNTPRKLTERETADIKLWFGWGSILKYPTGHKDYLRSALKPTRRGEFLSMPRELRKAILRFVIEENNRRKESVR